ncbi:MAG: hypothetical protein KDE14_00550 [Rhodobacteraceae bacterium]|nr:hypothetical protein [Paracoccaceae bacterium]
MVVKNKKAKVSRRAAPKSGSGKGWTQRRPRMRVSKGRRPFFFDDPAVDKLLGMVMALTGEVAVLRERLDTHERLAVEGKIATPANIEAYSPDLATEDAREAVRVDMLNRVFRMIAFTELPGQDNYQSLVDKFAK